MIPPVPYKGELPYIFISYAHKDSDRVWPIVARLQRDGYRVWYDEGIDPGTEWDENIAAHVTGCGYFIALLSENYMASNNCKDELNFSRDQGKPQLLIYLEDVDLPQGMAMRLGRIQAIFQDRYGDQEEFYAKLYESQDIEGFYGSNLPPKQNQAPKTAPKTFRMGKKTVLWPILAAIVLIAAAVAASFLWPKEAQNVPNVPTEISAQTEEKEPELKKVTNVVILDREDLKITALNTALDSRYFSLTLSIQNKAEAEVNLWTNNCYLNGVYFDPDQTISALSGVDTLVELRWDRETAEKYGIDLEAVTVIELSSYGYYEDDRGETEDINCVYYPYGEENVQRTVYTPTEQDVILLDTPEYLVVAQNPQPHEPGTVWSQDVVWINRTERDAIFRIHETNFNGYWQDKDWSRYVRPLGTYFGAIEYSRDYQWLAAAGGRVLQLQAVLDIYQSNYLNYEDPIHLSQPVTLYPEGEAAAAEVLAPRQLDPECILGENSLFRIAYLGTVPGQEEDTAELLYLENISDYFIDEYVGVDWYDGKDTIYYSSEDYALQPHTRTILQAERGQLPDSYWLYTTVYHYGFMHPDEDGYGGSYCMDTEYRVQPPKA